MREDNSARKSVGVWIGALGLVVAVAGTTFNYVGLQDAKKSDAEIRIIGPIQPNTGSSRYAVDEDMELRLENVGDRPAIGCDVIVGFRWDSAVGGPDENTGSHADRVIAVGRLDSTESAELAVEELVQAETSLDKVSAVTLSVQCEEGGQWVERWEAPR